MLNRFKKICESDIGPQKIKENIYDKLMDMDDDEFVEVLNQNHQDIMVEIYPMYMFDEILRDDEKSMLAPDFSKHDDFIYITPMGIYSHSYIDKDYAKQLANVIYLHPKRNPEFDDCYNDQDAADE